MKFGGVPKRWEDVSPDWMTAMLRSRHPDAEVSAVTLTERDDGTNRRARFSLEYSAGSGPANVFLKAHAANHRLVHLRNGNLFNESRLFACGAELPLEHPLVYRACPDYLRLDFLLVMEDLLDRDADPRDATRPMTVDQVASGLAGLARLHSRYWNFSRLSEPRLRWVKNWRPGRGWQIGLRKCVPRGLERGANELPPAVLALSADDIVDLWVRYVRELSRKPVTLLHGDTHIGNTYLLPDDTVGFLDWQVVRRGHWSQDAGCFPISALTEENRRRHETELVEGYRRALDVPEDQKPSPDEAWLWYRASTCYGLAIWLSTLGTDGYQSREVSAALARRFAAAFTELDGAAALAELESATGNAFFRG